MPEVDSPCTHTLNGAFKLWAHLPHVTNWDNDSYIYIHTFRSIHDTIAVMETVSSEIITKCMLFVMRDNVFPTWEDPANISGGCFSYKVSNKTVCHVWKNVVYAFVGDCISNRSDIRDAITGVTISPKRGFCVIKIWLSSSLCQDPRVISQQYTGLSPDGCLFKSHK